MANNHGIGGCNAIPGVYHVSAVKMASDKRGVPIQAGDRVQSDIGSEMYEVVSVVGDRVTVREYGMGASSATHIENAHDLVKMSASASRAVTMAINSGSCPYCGASDLLVTSDGKLPKHDARGAGGVCYGSGKVAKMSASPYTAAQMARAIAGARAMAWGDDKFAGDTVDCPKCGAETRMIGINPRLADHNTPSGGRCPYSGKYAEEIK